MRILMMAVLFVAACSSVAQSETRYDLYIFQPRDGSPEIYAFSGGQNAVAIEVRGCGDVRVLPSPRDVVADLSARRSAHDIGVVTVQGRGSRTELGECSAEERAEPQEMRDEDGLVIIEDTSARQMRAIVQSFDAAPSGVRDEIIATLGLD